VASRHRSGGNGRKARNDLPVSGVDTIHALRLSSSASSEGL
jgi:hypothetical protein